MLPKKTEKNKLNFIITLYWIFVFYFFLYLDLNVIYLYKFFTTFANQMFFYKTLVVIFIIKTILLLFLINFLFFVKKIKMINVNVSKICKLLFIFFTILLLGYLSVDTCYAMGADPLHRYDKFGMRAGYWGCDWRYSTKIFEQEYQLCLLRHSSNPLYYQIANQFILIVTSTQQQKFSYCEKYSTNCNEFTDLCREIFENLWKNIEIEVIKQNAIETAMIPPQNTFGDILFFGVLMLIVWYLVSKISRH